MRWIGFWDYNAGDYNSEVSYGERPGEALEMMKVYGAGAMPTLLAGASAYTGSAYKLALPTNYTIGILAQLASGHVEQIAWGSNPGQVAIMSDLTAQAAAAKAAAVPALTVTNSQGATATVVPNADGSAVIEITFPTTAAHVTYDLKLSSPRKLAFATAAGSVLGGFWQGGRLMADFTWGTSGGAARVYVGAQ